jgi:patatin-like phospholipase/acyl hydrolase
MIQHLVLSGAGSDGLIQLGMLEQLMVEMFSMDNIKSIYGTSAGSIIGILLCLKVPLQEIIDYFIQRPWDKWFKPDVFQFMESKGFVNSSCFQELLAPFFNAYDINISITLQELYERSGIDFHVFTTAVTHMKSVDLNHIDFPDLSAVQAICMSSSIPILFTPIQYKDEYYIDGGVLNHCPTINEEDVLVLMIDYKQQIDLQSTSHYIQHLVLKIFDIISLNTHIPEGKHVYCFNTVNSLFNPSLLEQALSNKSVRQSIFDMGKEFIKNIV